MVEPLSPDKAIIIAEKTYTLRSTMGVLKAIQTEFDTDVYDMAGNGILRLKFDELAKLIAISIGEGGPSEDDIQHNVVRVRGLDETKYLLMEWMIGAVSPESKREKNVKWLLEKISDLRKATAAMETDQEKTL